MSPELLTCPYCNAPLPAGSGGRVYCSRCGEPLPVRAGSGQLNPSQPSPAPSRTDGQARHFSNRAIARIVLGAMAVMALVGLAYALATVDFRHRNNERRPVLIVNKDLVEELRGTAPLAPAELPGLGYLPADTNIVAAVHVAEILRDPVGRKFLELPRPAPLDAALASVEQWTGLKAEGLDHVVVGTRIGTGSPLQVCLVVQTRQPYQQSAIASARAVHGAKPTEFRHKPLYPLTIGPIGNGLLWCADERTLVFLVRLDGTREEDLHAIPETPRPGDSGLPLPLRKVLEQRLGKGTPLWLAGHLDEPEILSAVLTLGQVPPEVQQVITSISTFGAGLRFQTGVTLMADFHTTDAAAARLLAGYLRRQTEPLGGKVASSPPRLAHAEILAAQVAACYAPLEPWPLTFATRLAAVAVAAHGVPGAEVNWVTLQVRGDADAIRRMLNDVSALLPHMGR